MKTLLALFCLSLLCSSLRADPKPDERYKADLLVVVAHPDDETEIGAYLARAIFDEKKRVAVVFGTRGNGGGNAEGQEQAAALGVLREIEARKALAHFGVMNVFFLNGLDTPGQDVLRSLETWNHGDSLGRLVRLVRLTRPAVVATWLPDYVAGENHGDHQAAGVLANEAFDLAGDATAYPEQITPPRNRFDIGNLTEGLRPWQPEKIYFFTDASHPQFTDGKGPTYSSKDMSTVKDVPYARLAAEECAFHLTQGDTGQMAREALAKNDLHYFEQPVRFIFGKSYVKSSATGDLFEGVAPEGIAYHRAPGFTARERSKPDLELGGPWRYYRDFWTAHGLDHLANLLKPEVMMNYLSVLNVPVVIDNPTDQTLPVTLSAEFPKEWTVEKHETSFTVAPHDTYSVDLRAKTQAAKATDRETVTVKAESGQKAIGTVSVSVQLDSGAMPQ